MKARVREGGFTLTELMTVVVIIGIMGTMAMVSVHRGRAEGQLDAFTNQIRNLMVQARRRSVGTSSTYMVDVTATTVQMCQIDPNNPGQLFCPTPLNILCSGAPCENSRVLIAGPEATASMGANQVDVGQGIGKVAIGAGHKPVYFFRDGTVDSMPGSTPGGRPTVEAGATIYTQGVNNPLKHRKIIVYPASGRPRIIDQW